MQSVNEVISAYGGPVAIAGLGWWLSGRFRCIERAQSAALDKHETEDERRHVENLKRFEKIAVALANLGHRNGP